MKTDTINLNDTVKLINGEIQSHHYRCAWSMNYNAEREREERKFCARASCMCVYASLYVCISVREAEKGRNEIFPLARAHARSIVPAGGHFVLARRPGVPRRPGENIGRRFSAAAYPSNVVPRNGDTSPSAKRSARRWRTWTSASRRASTVPRRPVGTRRLVRDAGQFVSRRIPFRGSPLVRGTAGHESTRECGEPWFVNIAEESNPSLAYSFEDFVYLF